MMTNETKKLTIGIIWLKKERWSRPFVQAHTQCLLGNKKLFYADSDLLPINQALFEKYLYGPTFGEFFPDFYGDRRLFSNFQIIRHFLLNKLLRIPIAQLRDEGLAQLLKKEKIDVVLAEFGKVAVAVMNACQKAGIPLVAHFHGADAYKQKTLQEYGPSYATLFRTASGLIAVSQDMKDQLQNLGAPPENIFLNPCGADISLFCGAVPQDAPPTFLSVGRFVEKKGHYTTLLAFQEMLKSCPQAKLVLIGDGPLLDSCILLCRALKISESVEFTGILPNAVIAEKMRGVRALVQHSLCAEDGDAEGTPVSILEAGASGLPVIATRHKGIREAVIHEKTGFLVDEGDVGGMARYMIQLAQDPQLAAQLGQNAQSWIVENYSQDKSIQKLYGILVHATQTRNAGRKNDP